jgi:hypothetical protein
MGIGIVRRTVNNRPAVRRRSWRQGWGGRGRGRGQGRRLRHGYRGVQHLSVGFKQILSFLWREVRDHVTPYFTRGNKSFAAHPAKELPLQVLF